MVKQLVYTSLLLIPVYHDSFDLWWKENLLYHQISQNFMNRIVAEATWTNYELNETIRNESS